MPEYRIIGVNKETKDDVELRVTAASPANAKVKAELDGVVVTAIIETGDVEQRERTAISVSNAKPAVSRAGSHVPAGYIPLDVSRPDFKEVIDAIGFGKARGKEIGGRMHIHVDDSKQYYGIPVSNTASPTSPTPDGYIPLDMTRRDASAAVDAIRSGDARGVVVGGWLLYFCLLLVVFRPIAWTGRLVESWLELQIIDRVPTLSSWGNNQAELYFAISFLVGLVLVIYGIVVGVIVWKGNPNGNLIAKRFLVISLLVGFLPAMFLLVNGRISLDTFEDSLPSTIGHTVACLVWLSYFKISRRVRGTYAGAATSSQMEPSPVTTVGSRFRVITIFVIIGLAASTLLSPFVGAVLGSVEKWHIKESVDRINQGQGTRNDVATVYDYFAKMAWKRRSKTLARRIGSVAAKAIPIVVEFGQADGAVPIHQR